jgi:hypothetical protein
MEATQPGAEAVVEGWVNTNVRVEPVEVRIPGLLKPEKLPNSELAAEGPS